MRLLLLRFNALGGSEFPFVFGGDGASLAVSAEIAKRRLTLCRPRQVGRLELGLKLRVPMVPMQEVRSHGFDVLVARYAVSEHLSYAMFSGGGIAWADAAMKRGEYAISPAPPDTWPNLTGLSCRFREIRSARGVILSVLVSPAPNANPAAFRTLAEGLIGLIEQSPDAGRPVPAGGPGFTWPSPGAELEARTAKGDRRLRRLKVLFETILLIDHAIGDTRGQLCAGAAPILRQVAQNSDFRKYDDGLRMVIDCSSQLADEIEQRLAGAAGAARYGRHRQQRAIMTCFTQSALRDDHVHFSSMAPRAVIPPPPRPARLRAYNLDEKDFQFLHKILNGRLGNAVLMNGQAPVRSASPASGGTAGQVVQSCPSTRRPGDQKRRGRAARASSRRRRLGAGRARSLLACRRLAP